MRRGEPWSANYSLVRSRRTPMWRNAVVCRVLQTLGLLVACICGSALGEPAQLRSCWGLSATSDHQKTPSPPHYHLFLASQPPCCYTTRRQQRDNM